MKKLYITSFLLFFTILVISAGGQKERLQSPSADASGISAQAAIGRMKTDSGPPYEGNGGSSIRLAVLLPEPLGDVPGYLPVYIQGLLNYNFRKYSDITLLERQNLETLLKEQEFAANGRFSETDYVRIGNLTNSQYLLMGKIQKLTGDTYSLQLSITNTSTGVNRSFFMKNGTLSQIERTGSLINEASAELLAGLGVRLTPSGRASLLAGNASAIQAETGLARGIVAQESGESVTALFNYTQAVIFDPGQLESLTRLGSVSTSISEGTISQRIVNDLLARDRWLEVFRETAAFFNQHPPFEIIFDPNLIQEGETDYARRTANLAMRVSLSPSNAGFQALNVLLEGLEQTGRRAAWGFAGWPFFDTGPGAAGTIVFGGKQKFTFRFDATLLNANGKVLGRSSVTLNSGQIPFSTGNRTVPFPPGDTALMSFQNIRAEDLTTSLMIVINSVNGISAERLGSTGYMRIEAGDLEMKLQTEQVVREQRAAVQKRSAEQRAVERERQEKQRAAEWESRWEKYWGEYSVIPALWFELGYVYEPDYVVGFRIGTWGLYTTWNFYIPDWQGYHTNSVRPGEKYGMSGWSAQDLGNREITSYEGIFGFSLNVINHILMIPIGMGFRSTTEYALLGVVNRQNYTEEWHPLSTRENLRELVFEAGVEVNPIKRISFLATYRLIGFTENSFTIGTCFTVPWNR